ncbi:hypothetical protein DLAC_04487 [Tieghemostelium lacteum]|uniref:AB hydrolase-1 domain-containing protein n=1 Tax=Tieghemostelium lacteum TaxID=361077 RepID=A0A151ZK54_TIELA|nr:hypothetical protein DLAC_04487 [Tieghemostelium lacteum]|eukprot:KYQ94194.1 hypothetical protein DLAC_04487 [Tieghemostelium lacteum]
MPKWSATHEDMEKAEKRMLSNLKCKYEQIQVKVGDNYINTIKVGEGKEPLVLIHGFGAALGFWTASLDHLSQYYTVYAFDLLGFGRSSRPNTSHITTKEEAEKFWTQSIYDWTEEMKLDKFNLLGHSLGGFLAGSFTLNHPDKVKRLVLLDAWGLPTPDPNLQLNFKVKLLSKVISPGLGLVRLSGPKLISKARSDLLMKFNDIHPVIPQDNSVNVIADYIYHSNSQIPATGENLFKLMCLPLGYAANPLQQRLKNIREDIEISFIYGQNSWISSRPGFELKEEMKNVKNVFIVEKAGHHIYIDNLKDFHDSLIKSIPVNVEATIFQENNRIHQQLHELNNTFEQLFPGTPISTAQSIN